MAAERPQIETVLESGRKPRWRRALFWLVVLSAIGGGGWWYVQQEQQAAQAAPLYETAPATRGRLTVTVSATGTVEPTNLVEISSELSGTVREVLVDHNSVVKKGQPLALLDTDTLNASLARSRATLEAKQARVREAEATLAEARDQLERIQSLSDRSVASASSVSTAVAANARAEAALEVARADIKVAQADLKMAETNLSKACICSPIDGLVLDRNVEPGQIVASSLQAPVLFRIAEDLSRMELQVAIDEADMGVVSVGKKAVFSVEAYQGRSFPAEIAELRYAPQTIDGVVTYEAILSIDNRDLLLRPGMTATAEILVEEVENAVLIPNAAFRFAPPEEAKPRSTGGGLLGFIMPRPPQKPATPPAPKADGTRLIHVLRGGAAIPVEVRPGPTDGQFTAVPEGIAEGDPVITSMALK